MEEYVKDCILTNEFTDLTLLRMVELTIYSIQNERPLFPTLMQEPAFYRKSFRMWVNEAMEEKRAMDTPLGHNPLLDEE